MRHSSRHHRKPRSLGGLTTKENISFVEETEHRAFHTLFKNWTPQKIAKKLNEKWLDPEWKFIVVRREEDE